MVWFMLASAHRVSSPGKCLPQDMVSPVILKFFLELLLLASVFLCHNYRDLPHALLSQSQAIALISTLHLSHYFSFSLLVRETQCLVSVFWPPPNKTRGLYCAVRARLEVRWCHNNISWKRQQQVAKDGRRDMELSRDRMGWWWMTTRCKIE